MTSTVLVGAQEANGMGRSRRIVISSMLRRYTDCSGSARSSMRV
jgi:hypothetical protein